MDFMCVTEFSFYFLLCITFVLLIELKFLKIIKYSLKLNSLEIEAGICELYAYRCLCLLCLSFGGEEVSDD